MQSNSILQNLNQKQHQAVVNTEGATLIFAGAGSGKTRILTHRIAYLLNEKKTVPNRILAVTFTNKAAGEMRERLKVLLGEQAQYVNMGTFHSINAKLLRIEAKNVGIHPNFTIYDSDDSLTVVKEAMKKLQYAKEMIQPNSAKYFISSLKQQLLLPEDAKDLSTNEHLVSEKINIYKEYQKILKQNNSFDFDDLLMEPILIFRKFPAILQKYQYKYDYILVDEYQDTNKVQFLFLEMLSGKHQNICVVGDDDQSIYSWRGADITNILNFESRYENPTIIKLEQNYRSTKNILRAASELVKNNKNRHPKTIWTENSVGDKITYSILDNGYREAEFIAKTIQKANNAGTPFQNFAILYRTNAQSRSLEEALRNRMIKYAIIGGIKFYERKEIKDILAYLRILVNPADSTSLLRIVNVPSRKIGKVTLDKISQFAESTQRSFLESLQYPAEAGAGAASKKIHGFLKVLHHLQQKLSKMTPTDFVRVLIEETGLIAQYKNSDSDSKDRDRIENINEFINGVQQFEYFNEGASIEDYLQEVSLITDIDQYNDKSNSVVLMTLHSAKGLEFPTVFLPGLEDGLLPLERSKENQNDYEEERRLFYVGITRAMKKVYITSANRRMKFGYENFSSPSPFIDEIPEDCIEQVSATPKKHTTISFDEKRSNKPVYSSGYSQAKTTRPTNPGKTRKLKPGDWVVHKIFGKGKIISISLSSQLFYKISFTGGVVKTIASKFVSAL